MYKEAVFLGLRFATNRGQLSMEQLCHLTPKELDDLAVKLEAEYKASGKKSFLTKRTPKDKEIKLRLDIVVDILNTKVDKAAVASEARADRLHNQKILGLIAEKQDAGLRDMSIEELEKQLK